MGPLAQLVAHLHDAQGVRGSSPLRPTQRNATCTSTSAKIPGRASVSGIAAPPARFQKAQYSNGAERRRT